MYQHIWTPDFPSTYNRIHGIITFLRLLARKNMAMASMVPKEHELKFLDRVNLLEFVEMANNAYYDHDLDTMLSKFGYDKDGLRIKVFEYDEFVVMAFKGTTLSLGMTRGTSKKDKSLDKILYSKCDEDDEDCKEQKRRAFSGIGYFEDAVEILNIVRFINDEENIILTGHSMGGTLASLVGVKYNLPVIAFSSAGDAHIANILGLYSNVKEHDNVVHIGMCSDVVFRGECNKRYSPCNILGYKIETKCHMGRSFCIKDGNNGSLIYHSINVLKTRLRSLDRITLIENFDSENCIH